MNLINPLASFLVSRFTKQHEHVVLVRFHSRLVKSVHAKDSAGYSTGHLVEIE